MESLVLPPESFFFGDVRDFRQAFLDFFSKNVNKQSQLKIFLCIVSHYQWTFLSLNAYITGDLDYQGI
jgi:hypothetical protein